MQGYAKNTHRVYTVGDWLFDCVNFAVPDSAVNYVCATRGVEPQTVYGEYVDAVCKAAENPAASDKVADIRLLKADLIKWIVLGAGKVNNTSDSDNGWSHSEGGYTMSDADKKLLLDEANAIYEELEPESVFAKKRIRMRSAGIMPAYRDLDGDPLPRRPI
jgi:hypothetical protein